MATIKDIAQAVYDELMLDGNDNLIVGEVTVAVTYSIDRDEESTDDDDLDWLEDWYQQCFRNEEE